MSPIKKKGGIIIKNKIFFLILLSCLLLPTIKVKAETTTFYEAEYIDNIYMTKYNFNTTAKYYQKARFFRKTGTNEFAYCIEPFKFFEETSPYQSTDKPNLTQSQLERITKLAYYGYGYNNHTDPKWYAITQLMIWQASDYSGNYYFTDTLNGQAVNRFLEEMNEINILVENSNKMPSFSNQKFLIIENSSLLLQDQNQVLNNFQSNNLIINNNTINIENLKEGEYSFNLTKKLDNYHKPLLFYQSNNSQDLVITGDLKEINTSFQVKVIKTKIQVTKIDKDTQSIIPSGNAILDGAIYELYDSNNNKIKELEIKSNQFIIENIPLGTYYLKEIKAGTGYTIDNTIHKVEITEENPKIDLILENEVIKKKLIIQKKYGEENNLLNEQDITFQIININNNEIKRITTNELGIAEIILPYGEYSIVQENSTEGYQKIDSITLKIENSEEELIELKDLKIPVPNTHINKHNLLDIIILILCILL